MGALRKLDEEGVRFKSHLDGYAFHLLTSVDPRLHGDPGRAGLGRGHGARGGRVPAASLAPREGRGQAVGAHVALGGAVAPGLTFARAGGPSVPFAIVQGGTFEDLRARRATPSSFALDFPATPSAGVSVGEPHGAHTPP